MTKINNVFKLMMNPTTLDEIMTRRIIGENCRYINPKQIQINETMSGVMNHNQMSALDNFAKQEKLNITFRPLDRDTLNLQVEQQGVKPHSLKVKLEEGKDTVADFMRSIYTSVETLINVVKREEKKPSVKLPFHGTLMDIRHYLHDIKVNSLRKYIQSHNNSLSDALSETYYTELYR